MYRFSIEGENWILRFSPQIFLEEVERTEIVNLLIQQGKDLFRFSHGSSFCLFTEKMGLIVFEIERIPSFILTINNVIRKENWYVEKDSKMRPFL